MAAPIPPIDPPETVEGSRLLTQDPVRITWVIYAVLQALVVVLLGTGAISTEVGAVLVGFLTAAYAAVSELFVRPETVPREPLDRLARAEETAAQETPPPAEP